MNGIPHEATEWPWKLPLYRHGELAAYCLLDREDFDRNEDQRWALAATGYAARGKRRVLHREILGLKLHDGLVTDHINRDRLDNRRENLRVVSQRENTQNMGAMRDCSSRFRGVSWHPHGAWIAYSTLDGRPHKIGRYLCETVAGLVAEAFRTKHMPLAYRTTELDPFRAAIDADELTCSDCGIIAPMRSGRYWRAENGRLLCQTCNGYRPPKRGPKFQPPKACSNCGKETTKQSLGRCNTCYCYRRRTGRDRTRW